MAEVFVALREITKVYPGTIATKDVSVEFRRGEIHALVGENGAGKSTLVKILAGLVQPDHGRIEVRGEIRHFGNPRASLLAGIGVVHQTGSLIDTLTVNENLKLGRMYAPRSVESQKIDRTQMVLPPDIQINALVSTLSPRQRQLVEIHRLMQQNAVLLILDEPTAHLTPQESVLLFRDLEVLATAGYTVVIISHKLAELVSHCHTFTVLRAGRVVARVNQCEASVAKLVRLCSGSDVTNSAGRSKTPRQSNSSKVLVELMNVTTAASDDEPIYGTNLALRAGEVVGLAGRPGSGVSTVLKILRKEPTHLSGGTVEWGFVSTRSFADGVGYVPSGGSRRGVILDLTVGENLKLRRRQLLSQLSSKTQRNEGRVFVDSLISGFDIRPANLGEKVRALSGGNTQKVLLAREMAHAKNLLIAESPTAGLDIGSAAFVQQRLRQKADEGACVVVHSDDLDELVGLCDRVVIMAGGRCKDELLGEQITTTSLGLKLSDTEVLFHPVNDSPLSQLRVSCDD